MSDVRIFTSFAYPHLSRAVALAQSLRRRHAEWRLCAVLVDRTLAGIDDDSWRRAFDVVLDAATLYGDAWRGFVFQHDLVEACAAVKGRALAHLFADGAEKVFYLSPEIGVFDDLAELERRLDDASILIAARQIEPNEAPAAIADNEAISMRCGAYDLGILGVLNDATGAALARWWASRLDEACFDDVANGLFIDQKYFDLVPALFDRVEILRNPGLGVASWNLSRRVIEFAADGRILVNGRYPLKLYHFPAPSGDGAMMTERYAGGRLAVFELAAAYARALAASEAPVVSVDAWAYGRYDDGAPIAKAARLHYRSYPDLRARYPDPFATGADCYRAHLQATHPDWA